MATEVKLPQLGQTMEEGTIVGCLVKVGDEVKKGDCIFEIETDKATLEVESPSAGFVKGILAQDGQTLLVGDVLLVLGEKDEQVDIKAGAKPAAAPAPKAPATAKAAPAKPATAPVEAPASANVVRLPQLGQTMEEGTIVGCLVKVGDEVKKGACIFEVETDKATLEVESPAEGFVKAILAKNEQTLLVGDVLLVLGDKDEEVPQAFIDSLSSGSAAATAPQETPVEKAAPQAAPAKKAGRVSASPRAKKLAKDMGVDIQTVTGTGKGGRITEDDIKNAAKGGAKPAKAAASGEIALGAVIPVNKLQKITAQRMLQSKREIPCFYLTARVDVTDMVKHRVKLNETSDTKIAYNDFIIKAVAAGLAKFPIMTGQLDGDTIKAADTVNVGLAMSVPEGLIVPAVKDAQKKDVAAISRDSKALIEKARNGKLKLTDLEGACITISNLGAFGVESFIPVVVPGQCSILGIGQISDTCVPENGGIVIRKLMLMTLSVDHKVANGAYAAQFLDFTREYLEDMANYA